MVAEWGDCSTAASTGDGSAASKCYSIRSVPKHNIQDGTNSIPYCSSTKKLEGSDQSTAVSSIINNTDVAKPVRCSNSPDFCYLQSPGHATSIASCLRQLAVEDNYHDMILLCDGKRIVAHKLVLSAASSFLKAILQSASESSPAVVSVEGVSWEVMQLLIQYIYLGEAIVPAHLLAEVITTGEALGVMGLKNFKEFLSPLPQTDPEVNRQENWSSPANKRVIHDTSISVCNKNSTTGADINTNSRLSSPQPQTKFRRRPSSLSLDEDSEAKKMKWSSADERLTINDGDQSPVDSSEEIEVVSPPHVLTNFSSTVTQERDNPAATTTSQDYNSTNGSSSNGVVETAAEALRRKTGQWHKNGDGITVASESVQVKNDSLHPPNNQDFTGKTASNCAAYSVESDNGVLATKVPPRYAGIESSHSVGPKQTFYSDHGEPSNYNKLGCLTSTGKPVSTASPHSFGNGMKQQNQARGVGDASSTLSSLVENMRAVEAGRSTNMHSHNTVVTEASMKSSNFFKENILALGSDLPAAKLYNKKHLQSAPNSVPSPLAQLLNVGEKQTPNYSAGLNSVIMAAGRAGTTSNGVTAQGVMPEGGNQGHNSGNDVNMGSTTSGYQKMNRFCEEQNLGNDTNKQIATTNDSHKNIIFANELKAEFKKQDDNLSMDSKSSEQMVCNTSNGISSQATMFGTGVADPEYFQRLGHLSTAALFNKNSDVSAFISSLVANGHFDHLKNKEENGNSGNTPVDHSANSRDATQASWDHRKNGVADDPSANDDDVKRPLLQQPITTLSGPRDGGACSAPTAHPTNDAEESKPQQHRFATQEEIDEALDMYQRKLAFHEPRPCPSCQRMYRDAATLRTHINIMHTPGTEPFVCSCGFLFRTKYEMYHHKKNGHYATSQPKL